MPPKRMTANPLAPQRYRAGKALPAREDSPSDSDSDSSDTSAHAPASKTSRAPPPSASSFPKIGTDLAARQRAAAEARAKDLAAQAKQDEEGFITASDSEESEEASGSESGSEEDSEDYESSEEESRPRFAAPTFVSRARRKDGGVESGGNGLSAQRDAEARAAEQEAEEERRRKEKADEMLRAQIEKAAREKAEGRQDWDEEDGAEMEDVDDRDGLDLEAEHAAWKLRELKRIKREREAIEVVEKEREEVERRRNLTAEEREAEDKEHIEKQKQEREGKGQMGFMQKYFHKGAFFQDDGEDDAIREAKNRDVMGARYMDDAVNRELLPQYMQVRDMTKLGKKGRTRYRDMKSEDTGRFGADLYDKRSRGDAGGRYEGPSGANEVAVGERRRRDDDRDGRDEKRPRYDR